MPPLSLRHIPPILVVLALAGCAAAAGSGAPDEPPPSPAAAGRFAIRLDSALRLLEPHRAEGLDERRFTHATLWRVLDQSLSSPALRVDTIGRSMHGRDLRAVTYGSGPTTVLLWSQMHGDEATATMSIADLLRFLTSDAAAGAAVRERLARELTVVFVPMLNPDGAELFQRENALGVDVNRDARRLATPEARALKALRDRLEPEFGFNLHDQNARTRAGRDGPQTAIALLAPAYDSARSYNEVRTRARLVAAAIAEGLARELPGRVARYDDGFTPRAFGDLMQQWGTSTVLIEAGALPDDPQKQRLRALNAAAILLALDAIATGNYREAAPVSYEQLPENAGGAYDRLVLGGTLVLPGAEPVRADVAINYGDAVARTEGTVREVGDLTDAIAVDTVNAAGLYLHPVAGTLHSTGAPGPGEARWFRIGAGARLELRRGADPASELVRVIAE